MIDPSKDQIRFTNMLRLLASTAFFCCAIFSMCSIASAQDLRPFKYGLNPLASGTSTTPRGNFILDIVTDPVTRQIWIATNKGPSVSYDGGKTWRNFYGTAAFHDDTASCSAIAAKNNLIVVGTATVKKVGDQDVQVGTGIHISTNGGDDWVHYTQPKDDPNDTIIHFFKSNLKALPIIVDEQNVAYSIGIQGASTIWIASFAGGTRKSTDLGKTWSRVILPPTNLAEINKDSIYTFGVTPVPARKYTGTDEEHLNYEGFSILIENDTTIWVGTADGINRSTDGGIDWFKFNAQNSQITGNFVVDLKLRAPGEVWAASAKARASTEHNGISYTTDGGFNWHAAADLLSDSTSTATSLVHKLGFIQSLIYAVNDEGLWRSSDAGRSWIRPSLIFNRDTREVVTRDTVLAIGALDTLLFAGTSDCLVSTIDSRDAPNPLSGPWHFYCFAEPVSTAEDNTYAYPNPFQPTQERTRIRYLVTNDQQVTIEVFDFRMHLVRTIIRDVMRSGGSGREFLELWDGSDNYGHRVPNATYFYKVTIGPDAHWGKIVVIR
jgi:hypothetical protein